MNAEDIVKYLEYCGATKIRSDGEKQIIACCPIHGENNPSFGVSLVKEGHPYHCFACGESGALPKLAVKTHNMSWAQALQLLNKFGEYTLDPSLKAFSSDGLMYDTRFNRQTKDEDEDEDAWREVLLDLSSYDVLSMRALIYLRSRHISREVALRAGLRQKGNRVLFPWFVDHIPVGITSRDYTSKEDQYRGMAIVEFDKHSQVYRACGPEGESPRSSMGILVEGEIDSLRVESFLRKQEYPEDMHAYALGGTSCTRAQTLRIASLMESVLVLPDNNRAGELMQEKVCYRLAERMPVWIISKGDEYVDPAESSDKLLRKMFHPKRRELV